MPNRLRAARDGATSRETGPAVPVPLMAIDLHQDTEDGPKTDRVLLWTNSDGLRCNWCQAGTCTFQPGPLGQGVCVLRRPASQAVFPRFSSPG
jgi:hypothetical protein